MAKTLAIATALLCSISAASFSRAKAQTQEAPTLTFADLKRGEIGKELFKIDGFVIEIHKCPPCPPGAMCKPCLGDYVVITDNIDEQDPLLIKRVRVFTDAPEKFELKKKYSFLAKVRGKVPEGKPVEDLNLIDLLLAY